MHKIQEIIAAQCEQLRKADLDPAEIAYYELFAVLLAEQAVAKLGTNFPKLLNMARKNGGSGADEPSAVRFSLGVKMDVSDIEAVTADVALTYTVPFKDLSRLSEKVGGERQGQLPIGQGHDQQEEPPHEEDGRPENSVGDGGPSTEGATTPPAESGQVPGDQNDAPEAETPRRRRRSTAAAGS